jgi:hypothetical protein
MPMPDEPALNSEHAMSEAPVVNKDEKSSPSLKAVLPQFDSIVGWLQPEEAEALFQAAAAVKSGCIVEVGSYRGRSTIALCAGSSVGAKLPVFAVDPHEEAVGVFGGKFGPQDRVAFFKNLLKTGMVTYVRLINTTSDIVARGWKAPVSLLFIDGDHRYESVSADFDAWLPHLGPGATVVFNEHKLAGPQRVIESAISLGQIEFANATNKIAFYRLIATATAQEHNENRSAIPNIQATTPERTPASEELRGEEYAVPIDDVAFHVYYGGAGKYLYQPITKCACTTIKTLLLEVENLPIDEDEWRRHQKRFNKFPGILGLPHEQRMDVFNGRTDTFKFVIARNPYMRLASVYCDKFVQKPDVYWIDQIRDSAAQQGMALSETITFEEFVTVVSRQSVAEMNDHWRPQFYEGRFQTIKFDFVGRMEMMPGDLIYALERIGAPESILQRAGEKSNVTGASLDLWRNVSPAARKLYLDTFAVDFNTLHYPRELVEDL